MPKHIVNQQDTLLTAPQRLAVQALLDNFVPYSAQVPPLSLVSGRLKWSARGDMTIPGRMNPPSQVDVARRVKRINPTTTTTTAYTTPLTSTTTKQVYIRLRHYTPRILPNTFPGLAKKPLALCLLTGPFTYRLSNGDRFRNKHSINRWWFSEPE